MQKNIPIKNQTKKSIQLIKSKIDKIGNNKMNILIKRVTKIKNKTKREFKLD